MSDNNQWRIDELLRAFFRRLLVTSISRSEFRYFFDNTDQPSCEICLWPPQLLESPKLFFDFYFLLPRHYNVDRIPGINYQNAQTTISNPITRFFICNINYHTEHHINPGIAQHHLPKIHEILKKDMEHIQRSYMKFHLGLAKSYFR